MDSKSETNLYFLYENGAEFVETLHFPTQFMLKCFNYPHFLIASLF